MILCAHSHHIPARSRNGERGHLPHYDSHHYKSGEDKDLFDFFTWLPTPMASPTFTVRCFQPAGK